MSDSTPHLTPEQLEMFREELLRMVARLERSMRTTDASARPVTLDQTSVGRLSRIDAIQNQSLAQGMQERERQKLAFLQAALRRLDEGTYGICTGCGEPILPERLAFFPEIPTCVQCAG
jgi:DnaK suppressor protein